MRRYFRELHKKSERHKKSFALFISGGVTLLIFSVWSAVEFGGQENLALETNNESQGEVTPFESLWGNVASSFEALRGSTRGIKEGVESINLELEYEEMRNSALESYE